MAYDITKKATLGHLKNLGTRVNAELTPVKARIKALEDVGAQANVLEAVKVNGTAQAITDKAVDIAVPVKVSDLTNDSKFQTDAEVESAINAKVASTYKAGGSVAFAALPTPDEAHLGFVYNVTDKFTTTAGFIEGAGSKHPAGTNVAIVAVTDGEATGYKYDVMAGFVDLSGLQPKEDGKGLSANDYTTEDKTKLGGIAEGATKVEASDTEGAIKVNGTDLQVVTIATDAEVTEMLNEVFGTAEA